MVMDVVYERVRDLGNVHHSRGVIGQQDKRSEFGDLLDFTFYDGSD